MWVTRYCIYCIKANGIYKVELALGFGTDLDPNCTWRVARNNYWYFFMTTDEIKQSVSMRDVVEQYGLHPNRAGFISCPFHQGDRSPSMKIYPKDYHCHACGANGDIFSFVMGMENCDFKTAFKALGGSYKRQSDHRRNLYHYHLQKRKETEEKRLMKIKQEKQEILEEIKLQKIFKKCFPVFSQDWCEAVNRLEYLFYRLEYLEEKR